MTMVIPLMHSFNPRLRAGGDPFNASSTSISSVSIHASAQEATKSPKQEAQAMIVSIHASAQEATPIVLSAALSLSVSIHASAQEATNRFQIHKRAKSFQSTPPRRRRQCKFTHAIPHFPCFNPRLRAGGDTTRMGEVLYYESFNPRLRAGGDHRHKADVIVAEKFQSTPPRRRRHVLCDDDCTLIIVSIHASAQEATKAKALCHDGDQVSIHASAQQAALFEHVADSPPIGFNPRLRAGGDQRSAEKSAAEMVSIHASAQEATERKTGRRDQLLRFNPRLRAGGDLLS